jgi:tetratricopeptide (TPR) repeat protein
VKRIDYYTVWGISLALQLCFAWSCAAQAPIDVERKASDGEFMAALTLFDKMPRRIATTGSVIAAARSAWALGLMDRAHAEYDAAIRSGKLSGIDEARCRFAKAAMYLQDSRPELAVLAIDEAIALLKEPSPLRGTMYVLKAQALAQQNLHPATVKLLMRAKDEVGEDSSIELSYLLGVSLTEVGRYAEAKEFLRKIPSSHDRAPEGIKQLIRIADAEHDSEKAAMWVAKGREAFPDQFLDGWYDYLLVEGAISRDQRGESAKEEIVKLREAAVAKLPASDSWLALLLAATEQYAWTSAQAKKLNLNSSLNGSSR